MRPTDDLPLACAPYRSPDISADAFWLLSDGLSNVVAGHAAVRLAVMTGIVAGLGQPATGNLLEVGMSGLFTCGADAREK